MVKDGEDWNGLQTAKLKSLAKLFNSFNRDWAPLRNWRYFFQHPIRKKTTPKRDSRARVFARFLSAACSHSVEFRLVYLIVDCFDLLWLVKVITLVLVLRHSVENLSNRYYSVKIWLQCSRNVYGCPLSTTERAGRVLMVGWLIDCVNDWLINCFLHWLTRRVICWLYFFLNFL